MQPNIPGALIDPFANQGPPVEAAIIPFRFWIKYKPQADGKMKAEDWVEWHAKLTGSQTIPRTCVESIERLKKGAKRATESGDEHAAIWRAMEPYYKNWKEGGTAEIINGTPLDVWPGVTHDVVELLKPFRIRSVEDLSMIGDQLLQKLPDPHMHMYRDRAKKFLETKDIAIAVRQLDESNQEIRELRAMVEKLQKSQANSDLARREAEQELDDATPAPVRKRRARAEATA